MTANRGIKGGTGLRIHRGSLYLSHEHYEKYFNGLDAVILVMQDAKMLLMPVHNEAGGGLLMKIRNAQGDRVVHAQEFLMFHGMDEVDAELTGSWDSDRCALVLETGTDPQD